MAIDQKLFEDSLDQLGGIAGYLSELPKHVSTWLDGLPINSDLKDFLSTHSGSGDFSVGPISFLPHRGMYSQTREFPFLIEAELLVIGSAPNGDLVVVRFHNGEVGFLSHETIWSTSNAEDVLTGFRKIASSLGTLARAALNDRDFPIDYHAR